MIRSMQEKQKIWIASTVYGVSLFYLLFQGGKTALMLFTILNLLAVYLILGRWSGISRVSGKHHITHIGEYEKKQHDVVWLAGTKLQVELTIMIPGIYPIPYVMIDDYLIRHDGQQLVFQSAVLPKWKRGGQLRYTTPALERGEYLFDRTICTTKDVFGLVEHSGMFRAQQKLYVQPQMIDITKWEKLIRSSSGVYAASSITRFAKETTQINGVRQYIHGDRLSRIHWNATARTGQLKSKEFEKEALPKLCVVLDCCMPPGGNEQADSFELAVSVAASLVSSGLRFSSAVGLVTVSDKATAFQSSTSSAERQLMLRHLTTIERSGAISLHQALQSMAAVIDPSAIVLLVSATKKEYLFSALQWLERKELHPQLFHTYISTKPTSSSTIGRQMSNRWPIYDVETLTQLRHVMERGGIG